MNEDWEHGRDWQRYVAHVRKDLIPMIDQSVMSMAIIAGSEPDVKQATELGFLLLMDKPLILVVFDEAEVPSGLRKAADAIVEIGSGSTNDPAVQARITAAMDALREAGRISD